MDCDISLWSICNFLRAETITAALHLSVLTVSFNEKSASERWRGAWKEKRGQKGAESGSIEPLDCQI